MKPRFTLLIPALAAAMVASTSLGAPQYNKSKPTNPKPPVEKAPTKAPETGPAGEAKFYDKLDAADREALQANVGFKMPAPQGHLDWIGGDSMMAADFRDQVTVIQVVNSKSGGRATLEKLKKTLPEGVKLIGLHTPDGADKAKTAFEKNPPCPIVVDTSGHWCDELGVWKRPVNIVIDKTGAVRFAGLSDLGLKNKLEPLLAEEVDDSVVPKERPTASKPASTEAAPTAWPTFTNQIDSAKDMRGQKLPRMVVQKWITAQPNFGSRLIAIDFWATWCPPCRASIPHINELNGKHGNDVAFVGISDESPNDFQQGLKKYKLDASSFTYSLGLDKGGTMKNQFFGLKGIPHMAIVSPDGVVRWQGHPTNLTEDDLTKLIAANKALTKAAPTPGKRGWVTATSQLAG